MLTEHRSRPRVRASFFCTCTVDPANFFLFCQPLDISRVSLFVFFFLFFSLFYGSVAQTLKNIGPLVCIASSTAACFGDGRYPLQQNFVVEFMHLTFFFLHTQRTFVWLFVVVSFFFSFIFSLFLSSSFCLFSFFLFSVGTSNNFFGG